MKTTFSYSPGIFRNQAPAILKSSKRSEVMGVDEKRPRTKFPITKPPKHNTQKQNTQDFKISKVTKCPKQQKAQITKHPKLQDVQSYRMFKIQNFLKMSK